MINRKIATSLFFILFSWFSILCKGHFQEMNTDQSGITDEDMRLSISILWVFRWESFSRESNSIMILEKEELALQIMQNLNADMFSGCMHDYKPP